MAVAPDHPGIEGHRRVREPLGLRLLLRQRRSAQLADGTREGLAADVFQAQAARGRERLGLRRQAVQHEHARVVEALQPAGLQRCIQLRR